MSIFFLYFTVYTNSVHWWKGMLNFSLRLWHDNSLICSSHDNERFARWKYWQEFWHFRTLFYYGTGLTHFINSQMTIVWFGTLPPGRLLWPKNICIVTKRLFLMTILYQLIFFKKGIFGWSLLSKLKNYCPHIKSKVLFIYIPRIYCLRVRSFICTSCGGGHQQAPGIETTARETLEHIYRTFWSFYYCHISHMTPVALLQHRAGAGPNKSSSSQFLELR